MRSKLLLLVVLGLPSILCGQTHGRFPRKPSNGLSRKSGTNSSCFPILGVFDNIKYSVNGYDVTLKGQVTNPTLKTRCGECGETHRGS